MDNIRIFLWAGLALLLWMNFQTWQKDYSSAPAAERPLSNDQATTLPGVPGSTDRSVNGSVDGSVDDRSNNSALDSVLPAIPDAPAVSKSPETGAAAPVASPNLIHVQTDVLDIQIDPRGGDIAADVALP